MNTQYSRTMDELEKCIKGMLERGYEAKYILTHWNTIIGHILNKIQEKEQ